jgi:hypothetical protein
MIRVALLLPLLAGCLYTDDINHRPELTIQATIGGLPVSGPLRVGDTVHIQSLTMDAEDGVGMDQVKFALRDVHQATPDKCVAQITQNLRDADVTIYVAGSYSVEAIATDLGNAKSMPADLTISATDRNPVLAGNSVAAAPGPTDCQAYNYTAGVPVFLYYGGSVADPRGPNHPPAGCPAWPALTLDWTVTGGSHPVLSIADPQGHCAPPAQGTAAATLSVPDYQTGVCLWTDDVVPAAGATYDVLFRASIEGLTAVKDDTVAVGPDQMPCITGADPIAASYVVDRAQHFSAEITGVDDDRDGYGSPDLHYAWSVWSQTDGSSSLPSGQWVEVPSYDHPAYDFDVSGYDVGEHLRLRVEVVDRTGTRASNAMCPMDQAQCLVCPCSTGGQADCAANTCRKWMTWDLELR